MRALMLLLKIFVLSFLSPTLFLGFYLVSTSFWDGAGIETVSTNVGVIDPASFFAFAAGGFCVLLAFFYGLSRLRFRELSVAELIEKRFGGVLVIPSVMGAFNLLGWLRGMEGNVFAFVYFIPLVLAVLLEIIFWFMASLFTEVRPKVKF